MERGSVPGVLSSFSKGDAGAVPLERWETLFAFAVAAFLEICAWTEH